MKTYPNLKSIKVGDLTFILRDGTSDIKAVKEVVINKSYRSEEHTSELQSQWI